MNGEPNHDLSTVWRRQFIIGRSLPDLSDLGFIKADVGAFELWTTDGLPVGSAGVVTVVGHAAALSGRGLIDHFSAVSSSSTPAEVAELALDLAGRFVLVAALDSGLILLTDGVASKRVFLAVDGSAASSSELLLERVGAPARPRTIAEENVVRSSRLASREYATLGLYSASSGFRRLLPNRVVDLTTGAVELCSPATGRTTHSVPDVARTLRRTVSSLSSLGTIDLGLTGGFDSRLILAALDAEGIAAETFTFVDGGERKQVDATIAKGVAAAVGFAHRSIEEPPPDDEILGLLRSSQTLVRPMRHVLSQLTWFSQNKGERLIISGLGGEIARSKFGLVPRQIGKELARRAALGHRPDPHDLFAFDEWWDDRFATQEGRTHLPATTLHHWEQRVPIWGAQFMSEKDLFVDELSAFSSGRLQQQLVSFPQHQRTSLTSSLFLDLIEELSADLARQDSPERSPWQHRVYDATPVPRLVRTLHRGWGEAS